MFFFNSGRHASSNFCSSGEMSPMGWILATPSTCLAREKTIMIYKQQILGGRENRETHAKLDIAGEEVDALVLVQRAFYERRRDHPSLAVQAPQYGVRESGASVGHAERGASRTVLGFDDLVSAKLDPFDELLPHVFGE